MVEPSGSSPEAGKNDKEVKFKDQVDEDDGFETVKSHKREKKNSVSKEVNKGGKLRTDHGRTQSMTITPSVPNAVKMEESHDDGWSTVGPKPKSRTTSHPNKNHFYRRSRNANSTQSNGGEDLDVYHVGELEEAFSDSDDDKPRDPSEAKPSIPLPRARIRTLSGTVAPVGFSPKWGGPTMCVSCLQFFNLPDDMCNFADHLLKEHKIVISEIDHIVDFKRYVEHWRQRFAKDSIEKVFSKVVPKKNEELFGKVDFYYLMTETLPEDYQVRQRLAMRRLEEALDCQQRERIDRSFEMNCIFCRYKASGNRSKIIHHLYMIHRLNLGSPENLVFVQEYIEHLKGKIDNHCCIFCEKVYPDRLALMDHMRKRNHREVNPKNNYYDKFYIINYLELGQRWLDIVNQDFEDNMPTFADSDEEDEVDNWKEWNEDKIDVEEIQVACLVCEHTEETLEEICQHMVKSHKFDLLKHIEEKELDTYGRMKLVNYIRNSSYHANCFMCTKDCKDLGELRAHMGQSDHLAGKLPQDEVWVNEANLVPCYGNDHLLWMLESHFEAKNFGENEDLIDEFQGLKTDDAYQKFVEISKRNTVEGVTAEEVGNLYDNAEKQRELVKDMQ
uniref:C2H2-type domain-containing protein n=1 Tax=Rhabditophanes sp. KR3021 TaxID=114890 RepID=A0AC35TKC8_9BILA